VKRISQRVISATDFGHTITVPPCILDDAAMRYYEYLSSAKVDMLYPQINQTSRSAGGEVGFDLKVIKASRKTDGSKAPTIYEKLTAVEEWIYANEPVGTVDEPEAWIYGRITLAAMIVSPDWSRPRPGQLTNGVVLFAGVSDTGAHVLLAGSARHLTANPDQPSTIESGYFSPSAGSALRQLLRDYQNLEDREKLEANRETLRTRAEMIIMPTWLGVVRLQGGA
jgi:hypothetical protein